MDTSEMLVRMDGPYLLPDSMYVTSFATKITMLAVIAAQQKGHVVTRQEDKATGKL